MNIESKKKSNTIKIFNRLSTYQHRKIEILNVPFSCCSFNELIDFFQIGIEKGIQGYVSITNTESLYHATKIPQHYNYIKGANFSCCDGVAVVLAGKMLNQKIPRLHGPDLMLSCCEIGISRGWRHYFYGGKNGVPEKVNNNFSKKFKNFNAVGCYSPPFRPLGFDEDKIIVDKINQANPDFLWVGLGLLKQENWIAEHLGKINVPWMIGVGAAFDFHAQTVKRAPKTFRTLGLEWLYRLFFEPRMLIRNFYSLLIFLKIFKEVLNKHEKIL